MQHSLTAHVEIHSTGCPAQFVPLRRLRNCVELHVSLADGAVSSTASSIPPLLHGAHYVPSEEQSVGVTPEKSVWVKARLPSSVYVLWPALQEPPHWLLSMFELVRGAEVGVKWLLSFKQRAYLNITNLRKAYQQQPMLVWRLYHTLKPGAEILLPPALPPAGSPTNLPWFDYILCIRLSSSATTGLLGNAQSSTAAVLAGKLLCGADIDPATCSLQLIYAGLEEGTYDPTVLSAAGASDLLSRVMLAADYELLTMLVDAGIGECCTQPCLQLLLQYAQLEGLPQMAHVVVQRTNVEVTFQLLTWLIRELLSSSTPADLEQLLTNYCIERRNPLSSISAVERALFKASALVSSQQQETALAIAGRFHGAKHALLQQLLQQSAEYRHAIAIGRMSVEMPDDQQGDEYALQARKESHLSPARPLQELLHQCFEEKAGKAIGRGSHASSSSIHDTSPYTAALRLPDVDFLSMPPVVEYTSRLWQGSELKTMLDLLLHEGDEETLRPAARKLRSAMMPAKAAVAFKQQLVPADAQAYSPNASGLGLAASSALFSSTGATALFDHSRHDASLKASGDGRCFLSVPGSTMLPGAVGSMSDDPSSAHFPRPGRLGVPGPCAEAVEGSAQSPLSARGMRAGFMTRPKSHSSTDGSQHSRIADGAACKAAAADRSAAISSIRWLEPSVGLELLHNMGLAGEGKQPLAWIASQAMHAALLAPRALHNSARGRWMQRCLFELLFLLWYQVSVMGLLSELLVVLVLPPIVVGNLVDVLFQLHYKYKNSLAVYLSDHVVKLNLFVNLGLLALIIWVPFNMTMASLDHTYEVFRQEPDDQVEGQQLPVIAVVASAFAVLVWIRALGVVIPASARLGAMLVTLRRAAEEAAVMIPLILVLMLGFSTSLTVVYRHVAMPEYSTIAGTMRMLVGATGGALDMLWFDQAADGNQFLAVWGQSIMTIYVVVVNILIMNLLIAVINYSYHPAVVSQETVVMYAQTVQHYGWQHRHGVAGSPCNILQLLLLWLPHGYRKRVDPMICIRWFVPPLDGYVPAAATAAPQLLIATGPAEVGYLAFLLTMYPIMSVIAVVALVLHTPFAVVHFALKGHSMWVESNWGSAGDDAAAEPEAVRPLAHQLSKRASVEIPSHILPPWGSDSTTQDAAAAHQRHPGGHARRKSMMLVRRNSVVLGPDTHALYTAAGASSAYWPPVRFTGSSGGAVPGLVPVHHIAGCWRWLSNSALSKALQAAWSVLQEPVISCCYSVLAIIVGLIVQLMLVVALAVALVWAWCTRVVFSLYCICIPSAANIPCCIQRARTANLWSKAAVQAAFAAADTVGGRLQPARSQQSALSDDGQSHVYTPSTTVNSPSRVSWAHKPWAGLSRNQQRSIDESSSHLQQQEAAPDVRTLTHIGSTASVTYFAAPPMHSPAAAFGAAIATAAALGCNGQPARNPSSTEGGVPGSGSNGSEAGWASGSAAAAATAHGLVPVSGPAGDASAGQQVNENTLPGCANEYGGVTMNTAMAAVAQGMSTEAGLEHGPAAATANSYQHIQQPTQLQETSEGDQQDIRAAGVKPAVHCRGGVVEQGHSSAATAAVSTSRSAAALIRVLTMNTDP